MRRVVSVYLPTWATDLWRRRNASRAPAWDSPLVVVASDCPRRVLVAVDRGTARRAVSGSVAALVLMRQKPGSANGTMFITLEDETAQANLIVWPPVFERHRRLILTAGMMGVQGRVQRQGLVVHVLVDGLIDLTALLRRVGDRTDGDTTFPLPQGRGDEARSRGRDQRESSAAGRHARIPETTVAPPGQVGHQRYRRATSDSSKIRILNPED